MLVAFLVAGRLSAEVTSAVSKDEFRCQSAVRAALAGQAAGHAACVRQCETDAALRGGPYTDCEAPNYGGATALCLDDGRGAAGHGSENRSLATMLARCAEDGARDTCPESYEATFGSCAQMAARRVADDHGTFSLFTQNVACEHENYLTDPTDGRRRAKCMTAVAKAAVAHFAKVTAVFQRCNAAIVKGRLQPGACVPGATSDPRLSPGNVVPRIKAHTAAVIDRRCFSPGTLAPACYNGMGLRPNTGAGWATLVDAITEQTVDARTFTASPGGAFLD